MPERPRGRIRPIPHSCYSVGLGGSSAYTIPTFYAHNEKWLSLGPKAAVMDAPASPADADVLSAHCPSIADPIASSQTANGSLLI